MIMKGTEVEESEGLGESSGESPDAVKANEALSNVLILRNIFQHLSIPDLRTCSHVNDMWKHEADSSMRQFNVQFFYSDMTYTETITVQEVFGLTRESRIYELSFEDLVPTLEMALNKSYRIHLALHLKRIDIKNRKLLDFVKCFGQFVFRLNYEASHFLNLHEFLNFLCAYLPNLEELHMDEFFLGPEEEEVKYETPGEYFLKNLKILSFFRQEPSFENRIEMYAEVFESILSLGRNLEEILCFPLERVEVLGSSGKAGLVKGIQYPHHRGVMQHEVRTWLQELARLKPQFKSFDPPRSPRMCPRRMMELSKVYVQSILKSSRKSLEHLVVFPSQRIGFLRYPVGMCAVRILEFLNESNYLEQAEKEECLKRSGLVPKKRRPWRIFFPAKTKLVELFPNVEEVRILLEEIRPENFQQYFPQKMFETIQPSKLYVSKEASQCLPELSQLFPKVNHLALDITDLKIKGLEGVMGKIQDFPNLSKLTLEIDSHRFFHDYNIIHRGNEWEEMAIFDTVITGIPEDICQALRKAKDFGSGDLEKYRSRHGLLAVKGLKTLDIVFNDKLPSCNYRWWWNCGCLPVTLFSEVSVFFGFMAHPDVEVTVRVQEEHPAIDTDTMIKSLGDALDYVNLDMNYQPPFYVKTNLPT